MKQADTKRKLDIICPSCQKKVVSFFFFKVVSMSSASGRKIACRLWWQQVAAANRVQPSEVIPGCTLLTGVQVAVGYSQKDIFKMCHYFPVRGETPAFCFHQRLVSRSALWLTDLETKSWSSAEPKLWLLALFRHQGARLTPLVTLPWGNVNAAHLQPGD